MQEELDEVARRIGAAWQTSVLTGTGLPGALGGLALTHPEDPAASLAGHLRDPVVTWELTLARRARAEAQAPRAAHELFARWSRRLRDLKVLTQDVAGLHDAAGTISVLELHGSVWDVGCALQCVTSSRRWRDARVAFDRVPPMCVYCGANLRPGELLVGESLPLDRVLRAHHAAQRCDVLLVVGLEVADDLVVSLLEAAKSPSTVVVQVGPSAGKRTRWLMDVVLEGPIDDVLTRLDAALPREPD